MLVFGVQIFTVNTEKVLYKLLFGASSEDKGEASREYITYTYVYSFDPLKPHFYIVKLGFTGVYIIFIIPAQNIDWGYSLEASARRF